VVSPNNVTIRPASLNDLDGIVGLWLAMMREHESFDPRVRLAAKAEDAYRQYVRFYIAQGEAAVFVADHRGEVVGYGLAYPANNLPMFRPKQYGYLSDLVISQSWRRRGVGHALVEATRQWFHRHGIAHIQLQVYCRNSLGRAFWRKEGFDDFVHGLWLAVSPMSQAGSPAGAPTNPQT
jgi:ribosomal protein S18 acetylase RimI-like enzyme